MAEPVEARPGDVARFVTRMTPVVERARRFSGWSFEDLNVSYSAGREPWDYEAAARVLLTGASRVVDLGTGGGEAFSRILAANRDVRAFATEEWHVNAPIAVRRLRIPVVQASSLDLPFRAAAFDLVLSRHEAIGPAEIDRVLAPGGVFLTQQVVPDNWPELRRYFPRKTVHPRHDIEYAAAFRSLGYVVEQQQCMYQAVFASLEGLVFVLLVTPWDIDLDVVADAEALLAVERDLARDQGIALTEGRYLLNARKPG